MDEKRFGLDTDLYLVLADFEIYLVSRILQNSKLNGIDLISVIL